MRITRLHLRNYRVYEDPVDLEIPPGLVGIYGPNGAGKSFLVESIRWTLHGRSRTSNDEVRTADIKDDCITEIEFEHEGHVYVVRRMISGAGSHVKASAEADGYQVAEGARETTRYVHSILGMDDAAFRASVFAEQKQLSAFSEQAPNERRRLVLSLLGITPLDAARDRARKDARERQEQFQSLRALLPDVEELQLRLKSFEEQAAAAVASATTAAHEVDGARLRFEDACRRYDAVDGLRQQHDQLVTEVTAVTADRARSAAIVDKLSRELDELAEAAERLEVLAPQAEGWREAEAKLRLVEAVVTAQHALNAIEVIPEPPIPDEEGCESARAAAETARADLAAVSGQLQGARAELDRARQSAARSDELTGEGACPLCGQELGVAFERVQAHRAAELAEAQARVEKLEADRARLAEGASLFAQRSHELARQLKEARAAWQVYQKADEQRLGAERALQQAELAFGRPVIGDERSELAADVERRRRAADECNRIRGRLERRDVAAAELDVERLLVVEHGRRLAGLAQKLDALDFQPEALVLARAGRDEASGVLDQLLERAESARVAVAQADSKLEAQVQRLADAHAQHAQLDSLSDEARHLGRVAELLSAFRNNQVAAVGPRLSSHASDLFGELTDHEYDQLEVDPDTYEIRVRDAGFLYGMSRFSGSETDLANLALRVAISEHVRFQSGGAVGLLVLDEVFGPLDDDRKERMLLALERLKARFRQVLVVTHDSDIKHQLPSAIEVVKLPGRRATARLVTAEV